MTLNFNPFPVLETNRLVLTSIMEEHKRDLYEMLSNPKVAEFDYFYPVETIDAVDDFIKRYEKQRLELDEITWGICLKGTNELIGTCCLGNFDERAKRSEIGYALKEKSWNQGFATEAIKVVLDYGFHQIKLNRIEATITPGNDASVRVLEKLNFTKEGWVRERDWIKNQLVDGIIMGLLAREYR